MENRLVLAVLVLLITIIVPAVFMVALLRSRFKNKVIYISFALMVIGYTLYIYYVYPWDWTSYYLRNILLILLLVSLLVSMVKTRNLPLFEKDRRTRVYLVMNIALALFFTLNLITGLKGKRTDKESIDLSFPLRNGKYFISQGGSTYVVNNHHITGAQRYALDIVKLNQLGSRADGIYPEALKSYSIFSEPVYSPCDGTVLRVVDGKEDMKPGKSDTENPAGNFVLIENEGNKILLAHLKKGSILVNAGQRVKIGQQVGMVGNSGNTSEPHLHIHAAKGGGNDHLEGTGIPIRFDGRFLVRNDIFEN